MLREIYAANGQQRGGSTTSSCANSSNRSICLWLMCAAVSTLTDTSSSSSKRFQSMDSPCQFSSCTSPICTSVPTRLVLYTLWNSKLCMLSRLFLMTWNGPLYQRTQTTLIFTRPPRKTTRKEAWWPPLGDTHVSIWRRNYPWDSRVEKTGHKGGNCTVYCTQERWVHAHDHLAERRVRPHASKECARPAKSRALYALRSCARREGRELMPLDCISCCALA